MFMEFSRWFLDGSLQNVQLLIEYSECVALWTFPTVPSQHNRYNLKIHAIWCIFFIEVCFDFTIDTHLQAGCHWLHMPQSIPAREWFQVRTQAKIDLSFVVFLGSLFYPRCVKHMLMKSLSAPRAFASSLLCPSIWQPQSQYKQPRTCLGLWAQIWHLQRRRKLVDFPAPSKWKPRQRQQGTIFFFLQDMDEQVYMRWMTEQALSFHGSAPQVCTLPPRQPAQGRIL